MTDGMKSTEFWFAVLVVVCATVLRITHDLDVDAWKWAVTTVGGAYVLGRSAVKAIDKTGAVRATRLLSELDAAPAPPHRTPKARKAET